MPVTAARGTAYDHRTLPSSSPDRLIPLAVRALVLRGADLLPFDAIIRRGRRCGSLPIGRSHMDRRRRPRKGGCEETRTWVKSGRPACVKRSTGLFTVHSLRVSKIRGVALHEGERVSRARVEPCYDPRPKSSALNTFTGEQCSRVDLYSPCARLVIYSRRVALHE